MKRAYVIAAAIGCLVATAVVWAALARPDVPPLPLVVAACAAPIAVAVALAGRLERPFPLPSVFGGALVGPAVALAGTAAVALLAAVLIAGLGAAAGDLFDELRVDPRLASVLGSPWLVVALAYLVVAAPVVEETGKALGARLFLGSRARNVDRATAFLAGTAAGAGFAIVENLLYVSFGAAFRGAWLDIALARTLATAVHPLATGLVLLGWWEWRHGAGRASARWVAAGIGVHALWNGSLVALLVAATAFHLEARPGDFALVGLAYSAALGAILLAALWAISGRIALGTLPARPPATDVRPVAAWLLLAASLLAPLAILVLSFPAVYGD